MEPTEREIITLLKIYIGQRVRSEGIVDKSLNSEEIMNLPSLLEKRLIENVIWKPFKSYKLYKTTEMGNKISSTFIQKILYKTNMAEELKKIPMIFLKICLFNDIYFYQHNCEFKFENFYWDDGVKELLIERCLEYWSKLIELFKSRNLCIQSYNYVSTRDGELREMFNIIPEPEVKEFLKAKLGIIEGLPEDIIKKLFEFRQKVIKKRENILFDEIIEDFSPKYAKVIEKDEEKILPILENKRILVFLSYSTKNEPTYRIKEIAEKLTQFYDIQGALYWQKDMEDNMSEYMSENIGKCDVFVIFCSPEALISGPINKEWSAADSLNKPILPVFTKKEHIPPLLSSRLGLEFDIFNLSDFVIRLHDLIIKKAKKTTL